MSKRLTVSLSKVNDRFKQSQQAIEELQTVLNQKNQKLLQSLYEDKTNIDEIEVTFTWNEVREIVLYEYQVLLDQLDLQVEETKKEKLKKIGKALKKNEK